MDDPRICKHDGELVYATDNIGTMRHCVFCRVFICLTADRYCSKDCARAHCAAGMLTPADDRNADISDYPVSQLAYIDRSKMS